MHDANSRPCATHTQRGVISASQQVPRRAAWRHALIRCGSYSPSMPRNVPSSGLRFMGNVLTTASLLMGPYCRACVRSKASAEVRTGATTRSTSEQCCCARAAMHVTGTAPCAGSPSAGTTGRRPLLSARPLCCQRVKPAHTRPACMRFGSCARSTIQLHAPRGARPARTLLLSFAASSTSTCHSACGLSV